ncbi:MAG: hypothetical protein ABW039_00370 [Sphingobium sp.]
MTTRATASEYDRIVALIAVAATGATSRRGVKMRNVDDNLR